jgi:putative acetyltransferase
MLRQESSLFDIRNGNKLLIIDTIFKDSHKELIAKQDHGMNYTVKSQPPESKEIRELSGALHKDLESRYGKGSIEDFVEENKTMLIFFVCRNDKNKAVACGALKHFDDTTAEIKRMYVADDSRGKGLSKLILNKLEETAFLMNYKRVILETGLKQPEAIKLYEKSGYTKIETYGKYKDDSNSLCYGKIIT